MVLEGFVLALWGIVVSLVQERFGKFQDLPANTKQLINALLTFVVPAVVNFVHPVWTPALGDESEVVTAALLLVAPVAIWVVSQFTHLFDRVLQKVGTV